jgi:hypothetical protein
LRGDSVILGTLRFPFFLTEFELSLLFFFWTQSADFGISDHLFI